MAITVKHPFVSTVPDATDTSLVRPSNWNADHTVTGLGTAAELNAGVANGVATLDGSGTVPISQLPAAVLGALSYQGTWNASTNTPTLTSSVGTKGYYYVVNVAGSTNLNGITDWLVGDWAVFNGSVWQKVDNTDAVTSVNGYTGTVVLTAADVNAVPYTGATTAVDLNAKSLTNVSNLGVGTAVVPTIKIRAVGDNNSSSRIAMRGYSSDANSSAIRVTKFRGTAGAPQAPQSGDSLGKFELAGYGTTSSDGYPQASLEGLATEAWGATARGTKAVIKVTPNTTTTQVTAVTIDQNSAATFASSVTATSFSGSGSGLTSIPNSALTNSAITINGTSTSLGGSISVGTVTSVTGTAPVVSSGGATPAISMPAATTSVSGYLTSTDWNTFNGKGTGTVTSVAATVPTGLSIAGSPITTSGTLAITYTAGYAIPTTASQTNWDTAYTDRLKWDGGSTGLVAATGRTSLGATTVGGNFFTLTNPSAITFPRMNADNTVSALDAATFRTAIGAGTGSGTVTSVGGTGTVNGITLTGTVTTSGNLTLGGTLSGVSLSTQVTGTLPIANGGTGATTRQDAMDALAGATTSGSYLRGNGTDVVMSTIQAADVPTLNQNTTGTASNVTGTVAIANGGTGQTTAVAAFNALNPMTTTGDIIYESSPTTAARLGIGSTGQVLTVAGGLPSWAAAPSSNITTLGLYENSATIAANYTIGTGNNAMSAGPITVNTGVTVTVPTGSTWVIV
jgi:hypothetical protein